MNNMRFEIIAGKINKIPEFYTIFAEIEARLRPNVWVRGQSSEARANLWGVEDLTSLVTCASLLD